MVLIRNIKLSYCIVLLMLLVSGGQYFYLMNGRYFVPFFLILSWYYHVKNNGRLIFNASTTFFIISVIYICINYFIINTGHIGNTFLPEMMLLFASYLFYTSFTFNGIKRLILNILYIMAITTVH